MCYFALNQKIINRTQVIKLAEAKIKNSLQEELAKKDKQLTELKAKRDTELAEKLSKKEIEISEMKTKIENTEVQKKLAVNVV